MRPFSPGRDDFHVVPEIWDAVERVHPSFSATRNPGAGQDLTGLAAAVQLRLRVALGLQTLTVKSRLLPGENTVRIRGGPPVSNCSRSSITRARRFERRR